MDLNFDTWTERVTRDLEEWSDNDHIDGELADELARVLDHGQDILARIAESVGAYEAGAANTGDPDAVVAEVAAILEGLDPTPHLDRSDDPDPLDRTVRDLWCAGCGTHTGPFVVHTETEVCLGCHNALSEAL